MMSSRQCLVWAFASGVLVCGSAACGQKVCWAFSEGNAGGVRRANVDGTSAQELVSAPEDVLGLALDLTGDGQVYWTTRVPITNDPAIGWTAITWNAVPTSTELTGRGAASIDLDVSGGKMYWAMEGPPREIRRANLDGSNEETIIPDLNGAPGDIAVDGMGGKVYWVVNESGSIARIDRANLDGSAVETIVTSAPFISGVALDLTAGEIYWFDGAFVKANLDGTNPQQVGIQVTDALDLEIDPSARMIYWIDDDRMSPNRILRSALDGPSHTIEVVRESTQGILIRDIALDLRDDGACAADVNGDCTVDVLDLLTVLESWGPCPERPPGDRGL